MGFDGAVNGANYMLGDSVSLINFINFIKVQFFPPSFGGQLVAAHRLVPFYKMAASMHSSLSSSSSLIAILYSNCSADRSPNAK